MMGQQLEREQVCECMCAHWRLDEAAGVVRVCVSAECVYVHGSVWPVVCVYA